MLKTSENAVRQIERMILASDWMIEYDRKTRAWYIIDKGRCCFITAGSAATMRESLLDFVETAVAQMITRGHNASSD